jgi:ABC-type uncharacterized transport system substrate-binding protein
MRRRAFITLLGGAAAAAWPLMARGQQREPMRRIGVLMNLAADDPEGQARVAAFLQGLQETGWAVGRNAQIHIRWGMSDAERSRKNATELVALMPDVLFATTFATVAALQQATRAVPIVFAGVIDPVGAGLLASLARTIQGVASSFGVELSPVVVRDVGEVEPAVAAFARSSNDGLIVTIGTLKRLSLPLHASRTEG